MTVDKIIIGAGLYGLYAAQKCGAAGQRVLVLERDPAPFMRATYINQARVHMGYHYPRSYSTAIKSAHYFQRFCRDYDFCLHTSFDQIYATSAHFSWTNAAEFRRFCAAAKIRCDDVAPERYFNNGMCDGAFLTTEYTYDAQVLKNWFLEQLAKLPNVQVLYSHKPDKIEKAGRSPDRQTLQPLLPAFGGRLRLHVRAGAHALAVTVWYDPEALELNSVTRGSAIDWENTLNHLDTSLPGRISLGVLYPGNEGMTQANNGIIHTMNFTVLAGTAEDSEIRVEVKKFNYMMTDDDQYPVPTQTQSGWIFVDGGEPGVPGDADGDGIVTAADALLVMRCALGTAELSPETAALCDTDGDGNVTLSDAVLILRAALGLG